MDADSVHKRSPIASGVLLAIVALDLSRANLAAYHTGPVEAATFTPPLYEALKTREGLLEPGRFRIVAIERKQFATPVPLRPLLGPYGAQSVERRQALDLEHNPLSRLHDLK